MKIQVLGPGCSRCKQLAANVQRAAAELGLEVQVEEVEDIKEIMKFHILATPALAIDGSVRSSGKVLSPEAVKDLLRA